MREVDLQCPQKVECIEPLPKFCRSAADFLKELAAEVAMVQEHWSRKWSDTQLALNV